MNQEIKKQWVEALRSGNYKQGDMLLRDTHDNFCCLGVLCDIHAKMFKKEWVQLDHVAYRYVDSQAALPLVVMLWAEIPDGFCSLPIDLVPIKVMDVLSSRDCGIDLADINDSKVFDFNQIADVIEKCL